MEALLASANGAAAAAAASGERERKSQRRGRDDTATSASASSGSASAASADAELITRMLRLSQQDLEAVLDAKMVVVPLQSEDLKDKMVQQSQHWDDQRPRATAEQLQTRAFTPHPLGYKKVWIHASLLDLLEPYASQAAEPPRATAVINHLLALSPEKASTVIASCKPTHPTPREGRVWKFELALHGLADTDSRAAWTTLIGLRSPDVRVEQRRVVQSDMVRSLWGTLKQRAPARQSQAPP